MTHRCRAPVTLAAAILVGAALLAATPAEASFESAWRVRPIRVIPQAPDNLASQVRVEGVMSFSGSPTAPWLPPRCGAIDFFCRTGNERTPFFCGGSVEECESLCKMAWKDIELAASRGQCVAFPLRLWAYPELVVKSLDAPFMSPNPFDPVMGVAVVPCQPESPSDQRPDLSMACALSAALDAGTQVTPEDAAPHQGPAAGTGGASGSGAAGTGGSGSGGGTGGQAVGGQSPPPAGGAGGSSSAAEAPASASCTVGSGRGGAAPAPLLGLLAALLAGALRGRSGQGTARRRSRGPSPTEGR